MSSVRHLSAPDSVARTGRESDVVAKAIVRHQREAASQSRTKEARQMETLRSGISEMVLTLSRSRRQSNAACSSGRTPVSFLPKRATSVSPAFLTIHAHKRDQALAFSIRPGLVYRAGPWGASPPT
jgi:hypothetical protein